MTWFHVALAVLSAAFPGASETSGQGWHSPVVLPARPLLDQQLAMRPALAASQDGEAALAYVAETGRGARMAVALRAAGGRGFREPRTLRGVSDLNDAGGRAPSIAAGAGGAFAVAWLGSAVHACRVPRVIVAIRRPGQRFGAPRELSRPDGIPLAAPPAVAIDAHGVTTVAWTEQRGGLRRVVAVRLGPTGRAGAPKQLAAGRSVGPPAAAGAAIAWDQDGRVRIARRLGARALDGGSALVSRAPALAAGRDGLAAAWARDGALRVVDPGGRARELPIDGPLRAGPLIGLDRAGRVTLAWQDARGVVAVAPGRAPQLVGRASLASVLSALSVGEDGHAVVTLVGAGDTGPALPRVRVASHRENGRFLTAVALSPPGRMTSLAAAGTPADGTDVVAWVTSLGVPQSGLLHVADRSSREAPRFGLVAPPAPRRAPEEPAAPPGTRLASCAGA